MGTSVTVHPSIRQYTPPPLLVQRRELRALLRARRARAVPLRALVLAVVVVVSRVPPSGPARAARRVRLRRRRVRRRVESVVVPVVVVRASRQKRARLRVFVLVERERLLLRVFERLVLARRDVVVRVRVRVPSRAPRRRRGRVVEPEPRQVRHRVGERRPRLRRRAVQRPTQRLHLGHVRLLPERERLRLRDSVPPPAAVGLVQLVELLAFDEPRAVRALQVDALEVIQIRRARLRLALQPRRLDRIADRVRALALVAVAVRRQRGLERDVLALALLERVRRRQRRRQRDAADDVRRRARVFVAALAVAAVLARVPRRLARGLASSREPPGRASCERVPGEPRRKSSEKVFPTRATPFPPAHAESHPFGRDVAATSAPSTPSSAAGGSPKPRGTPRRFVRCSAAMSRTKRGTVVAVRGWNVHSRSPSSSFVGEAIGQLNVLPVKR
eukprot:31439-Pelagococcus_subviridis.AAC.8